MSEFLGVAHVSSKLCFASVPTFSYKTVNGGKFEKQGWGSKKIYFLLPHMSLDDKDTLPQCAYVQTSFIIYIK